MELKKGISFLGVFSIASGAMISSGIFILPGLAYAKAGPAVFVSYGLAGVLGLVGILSVIELSTAMPKAGGAYYFINKAFGPMLGTMSGILNWFALSLKSAFAVFGLSEIVFLYTGTSPYISAAVLCLLFVAVNIAGVEEAAVFQIVMVIVLVGLMAVFVAAGLPGVSLSRFRPAAPYGFGAVFTTIGFVFISFGGLLNATNVSEEVKNPKKNIPLGIISSVVVVTILYSLITFVVTGTLEPEAFRSSLTSVADSAGVVLGRAGYIMITVASFLAFFTTANAGIMAASRFPMALSRDNLLPPVIAAVSRRFKTPVFSIIITGLVIYISLLLPLETLVKAASTVILTSYILTNIAVIILRESEVKNYRPSFRSPFYPWLQVFCVVMFSVLIAEMGSDAVEVSLLLLLISFCLYIFYGRKRQSSEYALLHLMKRIADKKLLNNTLESELREILISRDEIEQDHFDHLVSGARIYDLDKKMTFAELLDLTAEDLSLKAGMSAEDLKKRFMERQEDVNTALTDFLAIPHIVIDGEDEMFLAVVRNRAGIFFTRTENSVKAVFFLGGGRDKRLLHLKSLASIAALTEQEGFYEAWLEVSGPEDLKDLMLLSQRRRYH